MKNSIGLLSLLVILFSAQINFVHSAEPEHCPSVAQLKMTGLYFVEKNSTLPSNYYVYQINDYDTPFSWVFGISVNNAESETQAKKRANQILMNLSDKSWGPAQVLSPIPGVNSLYCKYYSEQQGWEAGLAYTLPNTPKAQFNALFKSQ